MSTVGSLNISQQNKDRKDHGIINSPRPLFQFMYESYLRGLHGLFFVFALSLGHSLELSLGTTIQNLLSVFVHFQFDDLHVGSVNADRDSGAVGLLALNALDVNNVFLSVDLSDFASLLSLVMAPGDDDFIVLSYGHASDIVLGPQILGEGGAHDLAPDVRWRLEVAAPVLSAG